MSIRISPLRAALLFAALGFIWVTVVDVFAALVAGDPLTAALLRAAEGVLFVSLASGLVYWLVARSRADVREARRELERAHDERAIYDRILRHNFRNGLQVLAGNLELATTASDSERRARIDDAADACDRLLDVCRDAREFSRIIDSGSTPQRVDIAAAVRSAADIAAAFPEASLEVDAPESAPARAVPEIDVAVRHIIENACEHAGEAPSVGITVRCRGERVVVRVDDDGPGVPLQEQVVLGADREQPLAHSTGLGLRITKWLLDHSGGDLEFEDGAVVLSFRSDRNP